ncbi:hypothetical protein HMPREF1318_3075 [Actinomyces massiliensis F0489]|uniref:Uncharacterized protein n=1 Tax=Actinomyces massiliensis F0489 TaxID=1125718 RepID=J1HMQ2_9ACTO|nr:hypothetical protein HMPREF1318_3075 [Actinomyces massiliensis F0489]
MRADALRLLGDAASLNRSRRGTGPISRRNRTDLDAEYDRSRD